MELEFNGFYGAQSMTCGDHVRTASNEKDPQQDAYEAIKLHYWKSRKAKTDIQGKADMICKARSPFIPMNQRRDSCLYGQYAAKIELDDSPGVKTRVNCHRTIVRKSQVCQSNRTPLRYYTTHQSTWHNACACRKSQR